MTISNIPMTKDIINLIYLLELMGSNIKKLSKNCYSFENKDIDINAIRTDSFRNISSKLRGSIMIIGPLLARFKEVSITKPGGDKIGRRRLDVHFKGLEKLGATTEFDDINNTYTIKATKLNPNYLILDEPSVTGTANLIMVCALIKGKTTIYNSACEPYIQQLCRMLQSMGAKIQGIGSNLLVIEGCEELSGTHHTIQPDIIEIGSLIGLAAITSSAITIKDVNTLNLGLTIDVFRSIGIEIILKKNEIFIPSQHNYNIKSFIDGSVLSIADGPWPLFTPDLLSVIIVVCTQAKGTILVHQKMFESRLFFVDRLIEMGAKIILCDPHRAVVIGLSKNTPLKATSLVSPDIRAGIALLIAALSAEGKSYIYNVVQIDRGYESIDQRLRSIGAKIKRVNH